MGCHLLLQGIFPTLGSNCSSPALAGRFFTTEPLGKPLCTLDHNIKMFKKRRHSRQNTAEGLERQYWWPDSRGHWETQAVVEQGRSPGRKLKEAKPGPHAHGILESAESQILEAQGRRGNTAGPRKAFLFFGPESSEADAPGPKFPAHVHLPVFGIPTPPGPGQGWEMYLLLRQGN